MIAAGISFELPDVASNQVEMITSMQFRHSNCSFCKCILAWSAICCGLVSAQEAAQEHPLVPAIEMARESLAALQNVQDYEATFTRRELVKNRQVSEQTQLRVRHQPFSIYMKTIAPSAGREVLYVAGKNQNHLLAREASGIRALGGTVRLPVTSPMVLANTRHPITDAGMKRLLELAIAQWELESKYGEIDVKFYPDAKIGNIACEVIESTHPQPRRQFPYSMTRVFFDKQTRFPIRAENYGFPKTPGDAAPLLEEFTYENIKVNVGLKDADFDHNNPNYSF